MCSEQEQSNFQAYDLTYSLDPHKHDWTSFLFRQRLNQLIVQVDYVAGKTFRISHQDYQRICTHLSAILQKTTLISVLNNHIYHKMLAWVGRWELSMLQKFVKNDEMLLFALLLQIWDAIWEQVFCIVLRSMVERHHALGKVYRSILLSFVKLNLSNHYKIIWFKSEKIRCRCNEW